MRRRTVAVDLRALVGEPTGIGVYTRSVLRALAAGGGGEAAWRAVGLAHRPPAGAGELVAAGVDVECQPAPSGLLWQQIRLPRRLARGDIDVFWSPLFTLPLALPVPGVVTVHDLTPLLYPETHRLKVLLSLYPFLARSLAAARQIVAISRATADDLLRCFPECADRVEVVLPGVDPEYAPGDPAAVAATRRELGCPDGYVLYAGTLEPRKNLPLLVDAWLALRRTAARTPPLLLAGPYGWGSRRLLDRLAALAPAGVRHLGRLPRRELVRLMQAARVFVYPSLYEGFGLPAAEAMACGVPVLAGRSSSLPEVVGDAGLLVAPEDGEALRSALGHLLADPVLATELGQRGRARAEDRFRWERTAAEMAAIFAAAAA